MINRKMKAVIIAIIANVFLIALKLFLSSFSGSVSIKASAWHSISDLIPSFLVLFGFILMESKLKFKFINKLENVIALVISLFIFYAGINLAMEILFSKTEKLSNILPTLIISIVTIAITYFLSRYQIHIGEEEKSPGLVANGKHSRVDLYSSFIVVFALTGYMIGLTTLDKIAGLVIVILIFSNGIEVFSSAIRALKKGDAIDEEIVHGNSIFEKIKKYFKWLIPVSVATILILYLITGIYTVDSGEAALVKRFGKFIDKKTAGLHYRLPWPIETVEIVNVEKIRNIQTSRNYLLSGDTNFIEIMATGHYRISDPYMYTFNSENPEQLISSVIQSAIQAEINITPVDGILSESKDLIQQKTLDSSRSKLDGLSIGAELVNIQLTLIKPPEEVMQAFRDQASAREDKNTYINEALSYKSEIVPIARGDGEKMLTEAKSYSEQKINISSGEAERFVSKLREYSKSPAVTKTRLYIEALEKGLKNAKKYIVDKNIIIENYDMYILKSDQAKIIN